MEDIGENRGSVPKNAERAGTCCHPEAQQKTKKKRADFSCAFRVVCLACVIAMAVGLGYALRAMHEPDVATLSAKEVFGQAQHYEPDSFSEIKNTKERLHALASEYIDWARARHASAVDGQDAPTDTQNSSAIRLFRQGVTLFKNTPQETRLVGELLRVLKREKRYHEWLDLYLETLYRTPTHNIGAQYFDDAVAIAKSVDRLADLRQAFMHVRQIPLASRTKEAISTHHFAKKKRP